MATATGMQFIFKRGKIVPKSEAMISLASHSLQYGSTCFAGIRGYVRNGKARVFRLKDHHERLMNASKIMGFGFTISYEKFEGIIARLIQENRPETDFYIRPFIYSETEAIGVGYKGLTFDLAIYMVPLKSYYQDDKGLRMAISSWEKISDTAMPTKAKAGGCYVNSSMATNDARAAGFDEALLMDRSQNIVEASVANIFLVYRGEIFSPAVGSDVLEGITMRSVIDLLKGRGYKIRHEPISRSMVYTCDEMFLTGTAAGVIFASSVDNKPIGKGVEGPVAKAIREEFQRVIEMEHPKSQEWVVEFQISKSSIRIFDTTLRDGEQSPGFAMKKEEKVSFAKKLEELGVDVIEAGFPIASPQDFEAVYAIAESCRKVEVCALARCNEKDIDCAIRALEKAEFPRIHVFIATSEIHMEHKLKMTRSQVIEKAVAGVKQAKVFTPRVEFSAEDASRSERDFLVQVLEAVIEAGADVLNIPDTVGFTTPEEYGGLIAYLKANVKGIEKAILSAHCHDDLGLAVANSLSAVLNGAGQVECTINGVGERAGNAALEEVVMAMKTKSGIYQANTSIQTQKLVAIGQSLTEITGHRVPPNKAIVGKNAFAHGSGIHQHGMLAHHETYAIMDPKDVGFEATEIVLSKHSGKHALKYRLEQLGIDPGALIDELFASFKDLADRKKCVYDEDLLILAKRLAPTI